MISDRYYMRANNPVRELAPLLWLIGALFAAFIAQRVVDSFWPGTTDAWLALSPNNILHGRVWTLLTYSVLHSPDSLWHLIGNTLGILFIGRILLPEIGARRFFWSFGAAVLAGGILWLAVNFLRGIPLVGASAGVSGLLALFCCRFANERMEFLVFFVVPVKIVPRYLLMAVAALVFLFFLFAELFPVGAPDGIAHSAHLAGLIAGIIAHRTMVKADDSFEESPRRAVELPAWMKKKSVSAPPPFKVDVSARENLKAEVDRILDKINTSGFGSLTAEEKRTLDEARNLMTKH